MSVPEVPGNSSEESGRTFLEEKLREVDRQLRREMRARGFDPDQADNLALTAPLARLYSEREQLREELESLAGSAGVTPRSKPTI